MWSHEDVQEIAGHLPEWMPALSEANPNLIRLESRHDPGAAVYLWREQHSNWVRLLGEYPKCWNGNKPRWKSRSRHNLDKLAAGIRKSFLPKYFDALKAARHHEQTFTTNQRLCSETCARLAAMIPDKESFSDFSVRSGLSRPDGQGVEMFVGNDVFGNVVVGMRLLRLSGDQAAAILRILFPE